MTMYDKETNQGGDPLKVRIPCEQCGGCGFGFYSICGTRENPFPSKDD